MPERRLNPIGDWYRLVYSCDCGGDKPFLRWICDDEGRRLFKVCELCEQRKMEKRREAEEEGGRADETL